MSKVCRIQLTGGNIRNYHFYLRQAVPMLPPNSIGGKNSSESGRPVTVRFIPGPTVETDVDGTKNIFRDRSSVREFLEKNAAVEGDFVVIEKTGDRTFEISLDDTGRAASSTPSASAAV